MFKIIQVVPYLVREEHFVEKRVFSGIMQEKVITMKKNREDTYKMEVDSGKKVCGIN